MTTSTDQPMPEPPPAEEPEQPGHGIGVTPPPAPTPLPSLAEDMRNGIWWLLGLLALIGICTWASMRDNTTGNDAAHARLACEEGVKGKLVSPASADFSDVTVTASGTTFTVIGTVDSDNALGASIRNRFTCRATLRGANWELRISGLTR